MSVVATQLVARVSVEGAEQAQSNLRQVGGAATTLNEKLGTLKPYNAGNAITDVDVAQAKLTLLESKVTEARDKLQTLQSAADAGQSVKGIPEAEANLVLLQEKAQQARSGLQGLLAGGEEANAGLQQVDTGSQEASSGLGTLLSHLQETAGEMAGGFLSSVKETVSTLSGGLLNGIKETASNLSGGFFGGIKSAAGGLIDFTGKIGLAYNGIQSMYQGAVGLGKAFLEPNASMEQTKVAFTQLLGSSKAADDELRSLSQFAAATPFQFPDLATAVQKLIAFQIPLKDTKPLLTAIGDALSGLGKNTPATLQQVVDVFGQMNSAGKIQTQDLMQLTSVGINGFQILADQMHKPVSVIHDMVTNGTIPATKGIEMLRAGMEKTFGGGMAAQAQTFNGLLSTFQDNIGQAWRTFTGPLFDAAKKGLETLGNLVSSKAFQDFATGAGQQVANTFSKIGQATEYVRNVLRTVPIADFRDAWKAVSGEMATVTKRFEDLGKRVSPLKQGFDPLAEVIQKLAKGGLDTLSNILWDVSKAFMSVDKATRQGKGPLVEVGNIFKDIKPVMQTLKPEIEKVGTAIISFSGPINLIQALARHSQDLGKWWHTSVVPALKDAQPHFASLSKAVGDLIPPFERIANVVHNNFQKSFDALLPSFEKLMPFLIRVSGLLAEGLGKSITFLTPYVEQATKALSDFGREISERVAPIISNWVDDMQKNITNFQKLWEKVWPYLAPFVEGVWHEIVGIVKLAWSIVSGIVKIGLDILGGDWKRAWDDFKDMLSGSWDGIKEYLSGAWEILKGMFSDAWKAIQAIFGPVGKWFGDRWKDIQNAFGNVGKWFQDQFTGAKNGTTSGFGDIGKWFDDRWKDIQAVFANIGKWFQDRWNDVINPLKPFLSYMGSVFQTVWNIITAIMGRIGKWFQDRWNDIATVFAVVGKWFSDRFNEAWKGITTAFAATGRWAQDRWNDITKVFSIVGTWFRDRWNEAWGGITAAFAATGRWAQDRWNDIVRVFNVVGSWFRARFQEAWNGITQLFAPVGKWFSDRWNDVMGGVNTFKNNIVAKFNETKTSVTNIFRDMVNGIVDQLNNGIGAVESFVNYFGKGLNDVAKALGTTGTIPMERLGRLPHYATGTPADGHPADGPAVVGEKGKELVFLPKGAKVVPNAQTEKLLALAGGNVPGYAGGIGDIAGNIMNWLGGGAQAILNGVISSLNIKAPNLPGMENISGAIFGKVKDWALGWISSILPKFSFGGGSGGSAVNIPGNVQSWIAAAMALTHVPSSWGGALATIAMHESGGNPNATNNWDINAQNGDPSRGLFQTIGATFSAYMLPGHGNIFSGIDNAAAAIQYIKARYGSVFNVPGIVSMSHGGPYVGYAGGVDYNPTAGTYWVGERGPEQVYLPKGAQVVPNHRLGQTPSTSSGQGVTIILELNGRQFARAVLPDITNTIRYDLGTRV